MKNLVVVLIFAAMCLAVDGGVFSSTDELEDLIQKEKKMISELMAFKKSYSGPNEAFLKRKISEHRAEMKIAEKDPKSYIYNPLNAYLLVKRLSVNFELFERRFASDPDSLKDLRARLTDVLQTYEDLVGAVEGLVRLQKVYHLKSSDFAQGIVAGRKTRRNLSVHDLGIIGRELLRLGNENFLALEYLQMAVDSYRSYEKDDIDIEKVSYALAEVHGNTGNYKAAVEAVDAYLKINETNQIAMDLRASYLRHFQIHGNNNFKIDNPFATEFEKNGIYSRSKEDIIFSKACRGELKNTVKATSKLHCRYYSETPYSLIGPFKTEEVSLSPVVVKLFYDVLYDNEIELFKKLTKDSLKAGMVFLRGKNEVLKTRVTKTAFIKDTAEEIVAKVSKRIEAMTKLSCKSAEPFQVQNYGIGGHYVPHYDATLENKQPFSLGTGNRLATVLLYMSEVELGGQTVFPFLNIRVPPMKGLGVFWSNTQHTGEVDFYTRHGSCPVLLGSKWVANKWLHEFQNEFLHPCKPNSSSELTESAFQKRFF